MLVTIATFSFPWEAQIARSKLDAEGIPAVVADEHTINMNWLYSNALGGVKLQVPYEFAKRAAEILEVAPDLVGDEPVEASNTPCPKCNSLETEYYQIGKRWAFLVWLGIGFPLFRVRDGVKCRVCGEISET